VSRFSSDLWWKFLVFSAIISVAGFGFDRMLIHEGVTRTDVLWLSNALTGVTAGIFFLEVKLRALERERVMQERLHKIAEMNHHVRNALQVVSFYAHQTTDDNVGRLVRESIQRIEWTLREVLPRGWNMPPQEYGPAYPDGPSPEDTTKLN